MMRKKKDDAVSPVIGVMLMLVVTIIIAAVVAVFASGVGTDAEPAPAAVLTVVDIEGGNAQTIVTTSTHRKSEEFRNWWRSEQNEELRSQYDDDSDFYLRTLGIAIYETQGYDEYLVGFDLSKDVHGWIVPIDDGYVSEGEPGSITIKSNGGDALELAKLSVKISDKSGNLLAESVSSATSDTLTTGGTHTFELSKTLSEKKVNVVILYGEKHVILDKEIEL